MSGTIIRIYHTTDTSHLLSLGPMDRLTNQTIEAVERRSGHFVRNCWKHEPGTITSLSNYLDWPVLQNRRKKARLIMLPKTIHSESEMELPNYCKRKK